MAGFYPVITDIFTLRRNKEIESESFHSHACFNHMVRPIIHRLKVSLADNFHIQLLKKEPNTFNSVTITPPIAIRTSLNVAHVSIKLPATPGPKSWVS